MFLLILLGLLFCPLSCHAQEIEPIPAAQDVILDEDIYMDIDDVEALIMAANLHNHGKINLRAVGCSVTGYSMSVGMHGVLGYYGLPDVPIGRCVYDDAYFPGLDSPYGRITYNAADKKTLVITKADTLYEHILDATETGRKVRIITTGYLNNVAKLLEDEAGYELVKEHCDYIYVVGSDYPKGMDNNLAYMNHAADSARFVLAHSPVPVIFQTNDTYVNTRTWEVATCGKNYEEFSPYSVFRQCLNAYREQANITTPLSAGNICADGVGVLAACLGTDGSQIAMVLDNNYIAGNGSNEFRADLAPNCYRAVRLTDDMNQYSSLLDYWLLGKEENE